MDVNKTYSAEDLLRYAHGQMPVAERHALEKAALNNPFLAEALDGYLETTDNRQQTAEIPQLDELRQIIADKAADKKKEKQVTIISIWQKKWLQRAVAAMLLFGTAWWLFSISNNQKQETVVTKNEQIAKNQTITKDSVSTEAAPSLVPPAASAYKTVNKQKQASIKTIKPSTDTTEKQIVLVDRKTFFANAPTKKVDTTVLPAKDMALNEPIADNSSAFKKASLSKTAFFGYSTQRKSELQNITVSKKLSFVFQGRVLDANNNPLPFSNIMVPGEDFGTYSDGEGYFNFVYTDSILPVRAKSLGFEAQNFNMLSNKKENRIVLNEDKNLDKSLTFLQSTKQKNRADFKPTIIKVDSISSTVEPFVGWRNYDLYLTNNNRISDLSQIGNRTVQLSFEISQDGGIKNITVEKSQGKDLDAEAIRLLKEGPKWKAQKDGEKGKVEVKF